MPLRPIHSRHPLEYETKPSILVINLIGLQSYGQTTKMSLDQIKGSIVVILNNNLLLTIGVSQLHRSRPLPGLRFSVAQQRP